MFRFVFIALVAAGCYNPKLANPGFFCHEDDVPPCPDGQQCVGGRCVGPGMHSISFQDMASAPDDHQDGGASNNDLAHAHGSQDLSMPQTTHDFAIVTSGMTGCAGLVQCLNACPTTDMTCPTTCQSNATSQGNSLLQSLLGCIQQACPSNVSTDPCYNTSSTKCNTCVMNAQQPGAACDSQLTACSNDTP
ncbi:MAG TPA: hypothetical protein VFF06_36295 [Polyangia bacterium]|nr:hypothetical protein [Polyangia bacterium]